MFDSCLLKMFAYLKSQAHSVSSLIGLGGKKQTCMHALMHCPAFSDDSGLIRRKKKILLVIENTKTLQISSQMVRRANLQHLHYVNKHTQETADMINCHD